MNKPELLIIDDDQELRTQMKWALSEDYEILLAEDRPSALQAFQTHRPALVTLDLGLPPFSSEAREGLRILEAMLAEDPLVKVVVVTGQDEKENALKAIDRGAYDFFCKPVDIPELKVVLKRALYLHRIEAENAALRQRVRVDGFEEMVGVSPQMQEVFAVIRKVATSDAPVLIAGQSGTGKELAARAIHRLSARAEGPFVPINCGAIPAELLESELFGHEKGAFTSAHIQRKGQLELAQDGTLFLDEVGELPLQLQVKLLRFLQDWRIQRVGGREEIPVSTRLVAATNVDLEEKMSIGEFREDLYYRLAVVVIDMPPLQEREGDLPLLAKFFLQRHSGESGKKITGFTREAERLMASHSWPGNIRELENCVRRAVIMAEDTRLTGSDLGLLPEGSAGPGRNLREAREALEKEMIKRALARNQGNITRAAKDLGISRPTLYELMDKLDINKD